MNKLEVNFDEIQKAMEDIAREAFDYFLDVETGEIIVLSEDILRRAREVLSQEFDEDLMDYEEVEFDNPPKIADWMEDEVELALDIFINEKDRYVRIPERDAQSGYRVMKGFAEQVEDLQLKKSLLAILNGPGAFRRFKDALDPHPKLKKIWYGFNAKAARDEIRKWLRTLSIESTS